MGTGKIKEVIRVEGATTAGIGSTLQISDYTQGSPSLIANDYTANNLPVLLPVEPEYLKPEREEEHPRWEEELPQPGT